MNDFKPNLNTHTVPLALLFSLLLHGWIAACIIINWKKPSVPSPPSILHLRFSYPAPGTHFPAIDQPKIRPPKPLLSATAHAKPNPPAPSGLSGKSNLSPVKTKPATALTDAISPPIYETKAVFTLPRRPTATPSSQPADLTAEAHSPQSEHPETISSTLVTAPVAPNELPTEGISLAQRFTPPLTPGYQRRRVWRAPINTDALPPPTPLSAPSPVPAPAASTLLIEQQQRETLTRQAQVAWAWTEWWTTPHAQELARNGEPDRAVCAPYQGTWRCIFNDIPNHPVTLDSESLIIALAAFQQSQGGTSVRLIRENNGSWNIIPFDHLPPPPPASIEHTTSSTPDTIQTRLN